jgi:hypothetical protein
MTAPIDPNYAAFLAAQQAAQQPQYVPQQFQQPQYVPYQQQPVYHAPAAIQQAPPAPSVPVDLADAMMAAQRRAAGSNGPSLFKLKEDAPGTAFDFVVSGPSTARQARFNGQPQTYQDGRPKVEILIPILVHPTQRHPEGKATLYAHGSAIGELVRAMAAAGCDEATISAGAEVGASGRATYLGKATRAGAQGNTYTENVFQFEYIRPALDGNPVNAAPAQVVAQPAPVQAVPVQPVAPVPVAQPVVQQPAAPAVAQSLPVPPVAQAPVQAPVPSLPANPDKAALLAKLTQQQQAG